MPDKTLYRSASNRMISGICGGLAEYFDVDASVMRVAMVAFTVITLPVFGPFVFLAYLVCIFIIPRDPGISPAMASDSSADGEHTDQSEQGVRKVAEKQPANRNNGMVWGGLLILLAVIVLAWSNALNFGRFSFFLPMVPIVAIGAAVFILFVYKGPIMEFFKHRRLYRLNEGKKIFGVCSGLADAFNLDPTLVRIGFFIVFLFSVGTVTLIYLFMAFIMPVGPPELSAEDR